MDIAIVGRHTKVSEDLRQKIFEKLERVEVLAPKATRAEVHVVHERNPRLTGDRERIEITLHDHGVIRVEAGGEDRVIALDAAMTKLTEQLRRKHEKKVNRNQTKVPLHAVPLADAVSGTEDVTVESVEVWEGAPPNVVREIAIDGTPITIRSKTHEGAPMTVTEAIDHMELVGHDFYLFHDVDSGLPSAVYRRRGWTYGVIHLESAGSAVAPLAGQAQRETA